MVTNGQTVKEGVFHNGQFYTGVFLVTVPTTIKHLVTAAKRQSRDERESNGKDNTLMLRRTMMDTKAVFAALYSVCEENATFFSGGAKGRRVTRLGGW
ncbi:hypothetical protein INR49_001574 [Caranx melampygus]|nr:hypothetical protein INR49_001574 [Caranx melampygus]